MTFVALFSFARTDKAVLSFVLLVLRRRLDRLRKIVRHGVNSSSLIGRLTWYHLSLLQTRGNNFYGFSATTTARAVEGPSSMEGRRWSLVTALTSAAAAAAFGR